MAAIGAKVGGDSPLTERRWKLRTRVVSTHKGQQEGELRHCPQNQAGHTHLGAGTKTINSVSRSSPPSL